MANAYLKDPDAVLDYKLDWANTRNGGTKPDWLPAGDTIATSTFTVPSGITKDSESNTTTTATVWLRGGTVGTDYTVTNRITTANGRTDDRSIVIQVREQ